MSERIAFISSYLSDPTRVDKNHMSIPDRTTRVCMLAAAELLRNKKINGIALSVVPELSGPIVTRLHQLLPRSLKNEDVFATEKTETTKGEVRVIKGLMQEENWSEVTLICAKFHQWRVEGNIERIFADKDTKPKVVSSNEVLLNLGDEKRKDRYEVIKKSESWEETKKFKVQEALAKAILKIPLIGPFIVYELPDYLPSKIWLQRKLHKFFD